MASCSYESEAPFRLGAFQDVLGPHFPPGVRRVKGWVFFAEDPARQQWFFHYSGRRRFECSIDPTPAAGQRKVRIVLIGTNLDVAAITALLTSACSAKEPVVLGTLDRSASDVATVESDDRFDLKTSLDNTSVIRFRMTACKPLEVTVEELEEKHGVDLNRVNLELQERVNYTTGPSFLTFDRGDDGEVWLRYSIQSQQQLAEIWPAVTTAADVLMKDVFAHVYACKCGW